MPAPLDPKIRAAVLADIQAENPQRNEIARKHHVSPSTVTKIAREEWLAGAFDRTQTLQAAHARRFDAKLARAQLVQDLYEDAQRLRRERIWAPYTQIVTGPVGAEFVTTKLPPLRDQQAGFTSVAICIDKAAKLTEQDSGDGSAGARSLLGRLGEALRVAAGQFDAEDQATADSATNRHPRD